MFDKLLVANRGEIACRIMRTAQRLGISCTAIYSDSDQNALHVAQADEAFRVGSNAATDSYLSTEHIIDAVRRSGASAVHPGYGFLSEDPLFAAACIEAGAIFIGPTPAQIEMMANKATAKKEMESVGVPVVPGYHGPQQDNTTLIAQILKIGFPVIVKPRAGGGGKGMRVATTGDDLGNLLDTCRREALSAFNDAGLIVERFLENPRHIEVQVFGDTYGNTVHFYERDCSLQRRHQKVIEEAPARELSSHLREGLIACALTVTKTIGYHGAGTVEFLLKDELFYFIEMNTRLQVEHPVTELITQTDLVEWQLRVAAGQPLPMTQEEIHCRGHAVQARLYAEDPTRDFLPTGGEVFFAQFPEPCAGIRVDNGVKVGDVIGIDYDPMIAKIIAYDTDATAAWSKLHTALMQTWLAGPKTNLSFLSNLSDSALSGTDVFDTGFISRHHSKLTAGPDPDNPAIQRIACWLLYTLGLRAAATQTVDTAWQSNDGWRANLPAKIHFRFGLDDQPIDLSACPIDANRLSFVGEQTTHSVEGQWLTANRLKVNDSDDLSLDIIAIEHATGHYLGMGGHFFRLVVTDGLTTQVDKAIRSGDVNAPMAGRVIDVRVTQGMEVEAGTILVVIEAMKMEHHLASPVTGHITSIATSIGQLVSEGHTLVKVTPLESLD